MADGERPVVEVVGSGGFTERLRDGGFRRITERSDVYAALILTSALFLLDSHTGVQTISVEVVSSATTVAAALTVVVLAALAGFVLTADEDTLDAVGGEAAYAAVLFGFELAVYLALTASVVGVFLGAYAQLLYERGLYTVAFFAFVFLFLYAVLAVATLASDLVAVGERAARP